MNKRQQQIFDNYCQSNLRTLRDCYGSYSYAKETAYEACMYRCYKQQGSNMRIISFNSMQFTIGWIFQVNNERYFHYETAHNIKEWRID